ncbi:hypothetical protein D3C78_719970 [compost metagenome]
MVVGDVLDQALEQDRVVARLQRIGNVVQVDFELRGRAFLDDGIGRQALLLGRFQHVLQAVDIFVEVVDEVDLGRLRTLARSGRARRLRTTVEVVLVDQVELQLERGADIQAQVIELAHHLAQHFARVGEERLALELVHGHQQLGSRALLPGFVAERAGDRVADPVGIADVQPKPCAFHGRAIDIQGEQRCRQVDPLFVHLVQAGPLDALATYHAIHVGDQQVYVLRVRMGLEEVIHLAGRTGARGYRRHGCTSFDLLRRCGDTAGASRATMVAAVVFLTFPSWGLVTRPGALIPGGSSTIKWPQRNRHWHFGK